MALPNPVVQPPRVSRKTSTTPPTTPPPRVEDPREAARKARQRARWIEELRRNADARRAAGQAPPPGSDQDNSDNPPPPPPPPDRHAGAGGLDANGVWTAPTNEYLAGLANKTIAPRWAGEPGSETYQGWLNMVNGGNPIPDGGLPPVAPPPGPDPDPNTGQQPRPNRHPNRHNRQNRQNQPGQVSQQAALALYNDNTIPHDFKGQLMELARSGNAQRFNEALFGSGLPQETKMRLMELFGFGGGGGGTAGGGGGVVGNPQGSPQPVPPNVGPPVPPNPRGSQYYGLY